VSLLLVPTTHAGTRPADGGVVNALSLAQRRWRAAADVRDWRLDISDDDALETLRARVCAVVLVTAGVLAVLAWLLAPAAFALDLSPSSVVAVAVLPLLGLVILYPGIRLSDGPLLGLLLAAQGIAAAVIATAQPPGSLTSAELVMLCPTIVGAVFFTGRAHVAVQLVSAMVATGWLAQGRLAGRDATAVVVLGELFVLAVVAVTVRLMRELAWYALEQAQRREVTDPLSGLANRRGLETLGGRRWRDHARHQRAVAILVVDVDHFKQVNDTLGHAGGDELIRRLGAALRRLMRSDDVAVRLGGEEFLLMAPVEPGESRVLGERIHQELTRSLDGRTVSIGAHEVLPGEDDTVPECLWQAVDRADQALYAAKRGGRNQVVLTTAVGPGRAAEPADVAPVVAAGSRGPGRGEPRTADAAQS